MADSNREFFTCNLFESLPFFKDDMASMEHPVFSLSTKPDMRVLHYEHNGNTITIKPSADGLPTIHDKDVLLYCASYLRAAISRGETPSQRVRFTAYDFFNSTNRQTCGVYYQNFEDCLNRLRGTTINTNIKTGRTTTASGFGLIDSWDAIKKDEQERAIAVEVKVSDWFYRAILANELLTIHWDYFQLRKPMERRLYEIARKHCGDGPTFKIGLDKLQKKVGTTAPLRKFRFSLRAIERDNRLPDYAIAFADDVVTFTHRHWQNPAVHVAPLFIGPPLKTETYEKAKQAAPGWDIYELERQWREWTAKKGVTPKRPNGAFIGFCRRKGPYP